MTRTIILMSIFGSFLIMSPNSARAQACSLADTLLACSHVSIESCRLSMSCEGDRTQAQSCQDVVEGMASRCCSKSTTKKRNRCISKDQRKITRALRAGHECLRTSAADSRCRLCIEYRTGCTYTEPVPELPV